MVAIFLVSAVGAAIGGGIVAYLAYELGQSHPTVAKERGNHSFALLDGFSLELWRQYKTVISGKELSANQREATAQRALFLVSRFRGQASIAEALLDMLDLMEKAGARAREHRRIGLRVNYSQFADLTEQMQGTFALLQLEAERLHSEAHYDQTPRILSSIDELLRRRRLRQPSAQGGRIASR